MNKYQDILLFAALLALVACSRPEAPVGAGADWDHYLGDAASSQYSRLDQINVDNVGQLQVAWTYRSGDADTANRSQIQCNPLVIGGVLYGTTPTLKLVALNAAGGQEKWRFDPFEGAFNQFGMGVNRGLAWWADGAERRLLYAVGSSLFAIDPATGRPIAGFGEGGRVDLHEGLGRDVADLFIAANTPGVVYKDLYILGMRVNESTGAAPGHIRAYDVRSGEQRWIFHTIPHPGETGHDTWPADAWQHIGGANAWAGLSLDAERGIVFVPTGSAAFDFYGGNRAGENLFANSLIALDAATGRRLWHFQTVHHDIWDRDLPAPPNLLTVTHQGREIAAVAQITKSGYVFLFDRVSGEPLFPIEEVAVPPSPLAGEAAWPTQPVPTRPEPFARHRFEEEDITRRTPEAYEYVRAIWAGARRGNFMPFSEEPTIIFPGFDGGGEWGGAAADPDGILYVNANEMPWLTQMKPYQTVQTDLLAERGRQIYSTACVTCHGQDLKGASAYGNAPTLVDLGRRRQPAEVDAVIRQGKGVMPSYANLADEEVNALVAFLTGSEEKMEGHAKEAAAEKDQWPYPYTFSGYNRFKDAEGFPAITPPWGTLNAIDLNSGEIIWKAPLGHHPGLPPPTGEPWGCENYGGPVVTAGNLLFIAATMDARIRAFDRRDGRLLWEAPLPAAGYATPAVYETGGKQYVVVACGGGKLGTPSGDAWVAFALP